MKKILSLCLAVLICGCGGGGGGEGGDATARACGVIGLNAKIINGEGCDNSGGSAVVRVMTTTDNGPQPICSGTLVTSDTVLTAAHCWTEAPQGIYIGNKGEGAYVPAIGASVAPGVRYESSVERIFNDVMLLKLSQPVNLPVMPILLSRSVQVGEPGFVYGYGAKESGENSNYSDFLTLESGAMTVANLTRDHVFVSFDGSGVNVCHGDSGGPLVVEVDGQPAIAGVVSQGSQGTCIAGEVTTFTNLQSPEVLSWLVDRIPNAYVRSL